MTDKKTYQLCIGKTYISQYCYYKKKSNIKIKRCDKNVVFTLFMITIFSQSTYITGVKRNHKLRLKNVNKRENPILKNR
jgi:hypothetical protein